MKYLRKIIWLVIAVVFIASIIVGLGVIFSVKNVNVTLTSYAYSEEMTEEEEQRANAELKAIKSAIIDNCGGKLMSYVNDAALAECFNDLDYAVVSYKKVFPCTLNVTVVERIETFAVSSGNSTFATYDSTGKLMHNGVRSTDINNPIIYVSGATTEQHIKVVAEVSKIFAEKFSALRAIVKSIDLDTRQGNMVFAMRSGIKIRIYDYANLTASKVQASYDKFFELDGVQKLSGSIIVTSPHGEPLAGYSESI